MQKKSSLRWVIALVVFGCLATLYVLSLALTERNLAAKLAKVKKPAVIDAYQQLTAELSGVAGTVPQFGPQDDSEFKGFPEDAAEIVAGYDRLFKRIERIEGLADYDSSYQDPPDDWSDEQRRRVAEFLGNHQDLVGEIQRMANRGGPLSALDLSQGFAVDLQHLDTLRSCCRLLRADAVTKASEGNHSEAVEDIIAGMKLGDALAQEPMLISQLVRFALYGTMCDAVQNSLDGGDLSPELTSQLMGQIDHADRRNAFAESLAGELYLGLDQFPDVEISGGTAGRILGVPLRPWLNADKGGYIEVMSRVISAAGLPYYEAAPELNRIEGGGGPWLLPRTGMAKGILAPAFAQSCQAQARHEAMLDLIQLGILIEQHHARTSSYPESLDVIARDLGTSLPVDPFTGEPYLYQSSDDGFLLYSIGQNLIDDGGRHDSRSGDIVWRGEQ